MKVNEVKIGNVIKWRGGLWRVQSMNHIKPGKGVAYQQMELRQLGVGNKTCERFSVDSTVNVVMIENIMHKFLYRDSGDLVFMEISSYAEVRVPEKLIPKEAKFLISDVDVELQFYGGDVIGIVLPSKILVAVEQTEQSLKGQSVTSSFKPAQVTNGIKTMVPLHINVGDNIFISTIDSSYIKKDSN